MKSTHLGKGRWYEKDPDVADAFRSIELLPEHYREILADVIVQVTNRLKNHNKNQGIISIGSDRVMGLMKAQQKRRKVDSNKLMHKAHTNLFILPDEQRTLMGERIYISVACLNEYFQACDRLNKLPDLREVATLLNEGIDKGLRAAEKFFIARNLYDQKTERVINNLYRKKPTEIIKEERIPAQQPTAEAQPTPPPTPQSKTKARIKTAQDGLKISRQDFL
jgi:hypothetical protein